MELFLLPDNLLDAAPLLGIAHLCVAIPTALHALLIKESQSTAIGWMGLVLLSPALGAALYWVFGTNRIRRRAAKRLRTRPEKIKSIADGAIPATLNKDWRWVARAGYAIHDSPYVAGNRIRPLINGDQAYPTMLGAINDAQSSVLLSSYIFNFDAAGRKFVEALTKARDRGVDVYVLIDGFGAGHGLNGTYRALRRSKIAVANFLPGSTLKGLRFINLRNHRKILCVDGSRAFVGGMNISAANVQAEQPRKPVQDVHFDVSGPVVEQFSEAFLEDWMYAAGKSIQLPEYRGGSGGTAIARAIPDGPDQKIDKIPWAIINAVNAAKMKVRITTPYFLPNNEMVSALQAAALRGVEVDVIIPAKSDLPGIGWAVDASLDKFLDYGIAVYKSPSPFDHSKLMLVDDYFSFVGSSNWDPRSIDLNFEINMECYDSALNLELNVLFEEKKAQAYRLRRSVYSANSWLGLLQRLRNNFFRLFSPYL